MWRVWGGAVARAAAGVVLTAHGFLPCFLYILLTKMLLWLECCSPPRPDPVPEGLMRLSAEPALCASACGMGLALVLGQCFVCF